MDVRCPACKTDLSRRPLGSTECPNCGSDLNIVIDLRETVEPRVAPAVLVVHDDAGIRRTLASVLEENGFHLASAVTNGPDAVLASQRQRPDYAIVERFMPAISGEETSRLIRRVSPNTVIVSFSDTPDDAPAWAEAHLSKTSASSAAELLRSLETAPVDEG